MTGSATEPSLFDLCDSFRDVGVTFICPGEHSYERDLPALDRHSFWGLGHS